MNKKKTAITMIEIMLAVSILALTFIPTMALFTSNVQITDRDKANIIAMNLCQEKLNTALNMSYRTFYKKLNGNNSITIDSGEIEDLASSSIILNLDTKRVESIDFSFSFYIEKKTINYHFMNFEWVATHSAWLDQEDDDISLSGIPTIGTLTNREIGDQVLIYKLMVTWKGKSSAAGGDATGPGKDIEKSYTLMTYKANLKSENLN